MEKLRGIAVLLLTVVLIGACAFTDSTLKLDYSASKHAKISAPADKINIAKFTDQRGVEPTLLANKGTIHRTTGKYYSDKEVASVVTDATKTLLAQLGYSVVDDAADFRLSGELLKFDSQVAVGFWSGTLDGSAQLNLKLSDTKNGSVVWNEMITATAKKDGLQIDAEYHRKEVADMLLDELMNKLAASSTFKEAFSNRPQAK
jgi:hypothetical protein